jgi:DNA (cytosine-5)-methyltransferase 1
MNDPTVLDRLATTADQRRTQRLALVGGPPCQGLSTGGNRRSTEDVRNKLHESYAALLRRLRPDIFVFENVLGLLSMERGTFVARVLTGLRAVGYDVAVWRLNAAQFGVPQRRQRVIIVGVPAGQPLPDAPVGWCGFTQGRLFEGPSACPVLDALGDLPPLIPGQDGTGLPYASPAGAQYQRFMRGEIAPADYLALAKEPDDQRGRSPSIQGVVGRPREVHPRSI